LAASCIVCQAIKFGKNALSVIMGERPALPAAALVRPCRAGRNVSIAMDLEASSAQIVVEAADAVKPDTDAAY